MQGEGLLTLSAFGFDYLPICHEVLMFADKKLKGDEKGNSDNFCHQTDIKD